MIKPHIPDIAYKLYIPVLSTVVIYLSLLQVNAFVLGVKNHYFGPPFEFWKLYFPSLNLNASLLPDITIQIIIGCIFFLLSRKTYLFILFQIIYMTLIYGGLGVHISYFGNPASVYDIYSFGALIEIIGIREKVVLLSPFVLMLGIFLYNFKYSIRNILIAAVLFVALPGAVFAYAKDINAFLNDIYPYKLWDKKYNHDARGASLYILEEVTRFVSNREEPPEKREVIQALDENSHEKQEKMSASSGARRNIHLIVVESLWDAKNLKNAGLSDDPFDPRFRELWNKTGNSMVMSPTFGGGTANAEFEILCGQPVTIDGIVFQTGLRNSELPCLPRILSRYGYHAIATHPNVPSYWNRVHSYRRLGFDEYKSERDIDMDDMNGDYLSNASLFRQNRERLVDILEDTPVFNYVLTIAEHWKYSLNSSRPDLVTSTSRDEFVQRYVNVIRYGTMELMDHLDELSSSDPDALVVILGDHLPLFGANMAGYRESGFFLKEKGEFSAKDAKQFSSTPLVVIDGKNGPQSLGTVSMFELPSIILSYSGVPVPSSLEVFLPIDNYKLRPVKGTGLLVSSDSLSFLCNSHDMTELQCRKYERWMENVKILSRDLRIGDQYVLKR